MSSDTRTSISMKAGGYYSSRTKGAKDVIDLATPSVLAAAAALPKGDAPLLIADFGAADGGTSLEMMGKLVRALKHREAGRSIVLTYTDLPRNDFSQVFNNTQGLGGAGDHLVGIDDLFIFASGTSFYRQIFPDAALDMGFSATAMHWLSSVPAEIPDHIHMVGASGPTLEAFTQQAMREWETILLCRAAELKPGGRLVLCNFGIDEEGRYLGNTGGQSMFDTFNLLWAKLASQGVITAQEYQATNFPQCYKTKQQFVAPLLEGGAAYQAGLRLVEAHTGFVPCPYQAEFVRSGNAEAYAPALIGTMRSWSDAVFFAGLDSARPEAERRGIVDRFYQSYEDLVREDPNGHAMDYVHVYMTIEKV